MQHSKLLFKILLLVISLNVRANFFGNYLDTIASKCGDINSLVVKKSLISLLKDSEHQCNDGFSRKILKECPSIASCNDLHQILSKVSSKSSGNIIGVSKD